MKPTETLYDKIFDTIENNSYLIEPLAVLAMAIAYVIFIYKAGLV
jgi:hypothetical protein